MSAWWGFWRYALVALMIAIGGGVLGAGAYDAMKGPFEWRYLGFAVLGTALFLVGFRLLLQLAKEIVNSSARELTRPYERQRRIVIMGLSTAKPPQRAAFAACLERFSIEEFARDSADFDALFAADEPKLFSNWQQNIRAIAAHGSLLKAVYVLPSEESENNIDDFLKPLRKKLPHIAVKCVSNEDGTPFSPSSRMEGRSYENYAYVHEGLKRAIRQAEGDFGETDLSRDICIDVTAGQKTFSIAGAIVTLNNDLLLGYVTTSGEAKFYDMSATFGSMGM